MKVYKRTSKSAYNRGGKKFGGGDSKGRFSPRDAGRPVMHKTVCAGCGASCEVPFKPNGSKPLYCNDCFKRDEKPRGGKFERGGFKKASFGDKRPFDAGARGPNGGGAVEKRLDALEAKIDRVLREIEALKGGA